MNKMKTKTKMRFTEHRRKHKYQMQCCEKLNAEENESYQSLQTKNQKPKTLIFAEEENIGPVHKFCHRIGFAKIK